MNIYFLMMELILVMVVIVDYLASQRLITIHVASKSIIMKEAIEKVKDEPDNILFPNEGKQYENDNYGFVLNNCQDFVSDVLDEYKKIEGVQ